MKKTFIKAKRLTWRYILVSALVLPGMNLLAQKNEPATNTLWLQTEYMGFFKNNEYFEDYAKGYTLTGSHITPTLNYSFHQSVVLKAGAHLLKYNGIESFSIANPFLSIHLNFAPGANLILGSFTQNQRQALSGILFSAENAMTDFVEEGVLFKFHQKRTLLEAWIDWRQFIFFGEDQQEHFNAGVSASWKIYQGESDVLKLSGEGITMHHGGQIDISDMPVSTLLNGAFSLKYSREFQSDFIKEAGGYIALQTFNDINGNGLYAFQSGWGNEFRLDLTFNSFSLSPGFWRSENFVAPYGHPLFQATSINSPSLPSNNNDITYLKAKYTYNFGDAVKMIFGGNLYYLNDQESWHHDLKIQIIFSEEFFITKTK